MTSMTSTCPVLSLRGEHNIKIEHPCLRGRKQKHDGNALRGRGAVNCVVSIHASVKSVQRELAPCLAERACIAGLGTQSGRETTSEIGDDR